MRTAAARIRNCLPCAAAPLPPKWPCVPRPAPTTLYGCAWCSQCACLMPLASTHTTKHNTSKQGTCTHTHHKTRHQQTRNTHEHTHTHTNTPRSHVDAQKDFSFICGGERVACFTTCFFPLITPALLHLYYSLYIKSPPPRPRPAYRRSGHSAAEV